MSKSASVPPYEAMLDAYHRAFATELRAMIAGLPIEAGQTILDLACGDGVYSPWLAERVGPSGRVVAVDRVREYLAIAREKARKSSLTLTVWLIPIRANICWTIPTSRQHVSTTSCVGEKHCRR
jgi:cyclopropane fatty-acyl-phospholipid synthase-like methyltransferase